MLYSTSEATPSNVANAVAPPISANRRRLTAYHLGATWIESQREKENRTWVDAHDEQISNEGQWVGLWEDVWINDTWTDGYWQWV